MRFGVVGSPVAHSLSPAIYNAGFVASGIDASYGLLETAPDRFCDIVEALRSGELSGANVTMPHKTNAFAAVDEASEGATRTHAVNTLVVRDGRLIGHNTDIFGVVGAIEGMASVGAAAPVLILGAGPAAAAALIATEARPVFISARRPEAAAAALDTTGVAGTVVPWTEGVAGAVVVNATPLGMHGEALPHSCLTAASAILDMAYGSGTTSAVAWMARNGRPTADGIDMLVAQALVAFRVFTGTDAPRDAMEAAARGAITT